MGVVFLAAVVFGLLSYFQLPVNLMPELTYPTLTVRTEYPGAAPEEVENEVSRPIEEVLGVISGLQRVSSVSRAGVSDVILEFGWDISMSDAVQDTLERLDQVFLPAEAERPLVLRFDPSLDPVLELSLAGQGDRFAGEEGLRRLRRLAELQVKRELEPIKGVAAVQIRGGLDEEIHVRLRRAELARVGLSARRVLERLAAENVNVAGGTLEEGSVEYMVRTLNEFTSLEQIADTVVVIHEGRVVRVRDLGEVVRAHRERQISTRSDGLESVQLDVYREADANMVALSRRIRAALGPPPGEGVAAADSGDGGRDGSPAGARGAAGLASRLLDREGARLEIVADRSIFIESSIREVRQSALIGGLLAVLVLYLFLRSFRSTAIIAVSIPASLLITFAPMNLFGVSLNIMSLGGLALGIGMLVDSSIVVLESIFRCGEEGDDLLSAVVRGTREVRSAVVASTVTTIAVFLPMVFVEGVAGQAFGDLGLAVVMSLLASLAVALFLIPMLAAREVGRVVVPGGAAPPRLRLAAVASLRTDWRVLGGGLRRWLVAPLLLVRTAVWAPVEMAAKIVFGLAALVVGVFAAAGSLLMAALGWLMERGPSRWMETGFARLREGYRRALERALDRPAAVAAVVAVALVITFQVFRGMDTELLPEVHQGEITFELAFSAGTPLEETIARLVPIERAILEEREGIASVLVTYGFDPVFSQRSDEGEQTARFRLLLASSDPRLEQEVIGRLRQRFAELPDLSQQVSRPVLFTFRTPVEVEVHGHDLIELRRKAGEVERVMAGLPALADVQTTLRSGAPEIEIVYDRERLMRSGLDLARVAHEIRDLVQGAEATLFNLRDRRIPIVVQLAEADRRSVEDVREVVINPGAERPISLGAVADVRLGEGPSEVRRVNGRRVALVRANLATGFSLGAAVEQVRVALDEEVSWPAQMTYLLAGQSEEWQRSSRSLVLALALSIFLVYVIMAAQFESLLHPFVILFTIPLAFFGTAVTLSAAGMSLSIVVFLGMILLAGIVVNNAIVLVDYVNILRGRGRERRAALVEAGTVRLRPILMTTATTVLGLTPMALGFGDGAELRTPMAVAVIGGLVVSTALTLLVIPCIYELVEGVADRVRSRGAAREVGAYGSAAIEEAAL